MSLWSVDQTAIKEKRKCSSHTPNWRYARFKSQVRPTKRQELPWSCMQGFTTAATSSMVSTWSFSGSPTLRLDTCHRSSLVRCRHSFKSRNMKLRGLTCAANTPAQRIHPASGKPTLASSDMRVRVPATQQHGASQNACPSTLTSSETRPDSNELLFNNLRLPQQLHHELGPLYPYPPQLNGHARHAWRWLFRGVQAVSPVASWSEPISPLKTIKALVDDVSKTSLSSIWLCVNPLLSIPHL